MEGNMTSVLEGITVLDFTQVYSGPFCTMMLKDLGAEIIKIERPGSGDLIRSDFPHTEGLEAGNFIILNRGKKSATINLKEAKGIAICKDLVKNVDVLLENFSPGTMDKLGLGSREMCEINPSLIYASISAYGQTGPYRDYPGFDPVAQAMGGMTAVTGFPGQPVRCGISIADFTTGLFASLAIVGAILHRLKTGEGQVIDISMQESVWQLSSIEFSPYWFLAGQEPPLLGNGHPYMIPCNLYPTTDGRVLIAAGVLDQVRRLYRTMGRDDLLDTPLCSNQRERYKHRDEIDEAISAWTKNLSTDEVMNTLKAADVPCSKLPKYSEVCNDPQLLARNAIIEVEQLVSGKVKVPGSLFKMSRTPGRMDYPAPFLGEHNQEILSGRLGYSEEEIKQMSDKGII
jgi:CoA:oxalate CoA-transferase